MLCMPRSVHLLAAWLLLTLVAPAWSQEVASPPRSEDQAGPKTQDRPKADHQGSPHRHDGGRTYMGRPIADVMSYLGANWLFRPSRVQEEQPEKMLDALGIKPGMTVADVGAGAGYQSLRLSRRVGPEGTVLATDIQPEMLKMLRFNARRAGAKNIKPILCTQTDPGLPEGQVDLILLVDVYHEVSDPPASLKGWRQALKPGGRLVLVEFRAEDPTVPIKPEHKMTVEQVRKEIEPCGFKFKELHDFLPWQHIIIFEKPTDADREEALDQGQGDEPVAGTTAEQPSR